MKRLFEVIHNGKRKFVFLKDMYGHNRVNIGINPKYSSSLIDSMEFRFLCEDPRFNQNAFFTSNRFIFNGLTPEDLSPEEFAMYQQDLIIEKF